MRIVIAVIVALAGVAHAQTAGNCWHIPAGSEPGIAVMRGPVHGVVAGTNVLVYSGNQFQGSGNPGNQLQTGSAVIFRHAGDAAWTTVQMTYSSTSGNNKYYVATIPGTALGSGDVVQYYLRIAYSDHATTFIYGGDELAHTTLDENTARAAPYQFGVEWPLQPSGATAAISGGAWQATIYTDSGHVALGNTVLAPPAAKVGDNWLPIGRVVAQQSIANGISLQQTWGERTITAQLRFVADGVLRYEVTDWGGAAPTETQIAGPSDASEHFYGLGEKFDGLDQAGKSVHVLTSDFAGAKGDHSYLVAPWFVSSRGYGFHLDSTAEARFDLRATAPDRFTAHLLAGSLAVNVVGGPAATDVLKRYTSYAGRAAMIPPWALGPWISSDVWRDGGEVRYVVEKEAALGIPASVFVFDSPWELAYNDFQWNTTQFAAGNTYEGVHYDGFASASDMLAYLGAHNLKVVVWLTPFIDVSSNNEGIAGENLGKASTYDFAAQHGYFVRQSPGGAPLVVTWWKGTGSPVDFTNPQAAAWFVAQLQQVVAASNGVIAGFKTDDGEADYIPLTASYADGRTGAEMRNGYCVEYLKTIWNILGTNGLVFARSGFVGTQAYPAVWAGDNEPNFGTDNGLPSVLSAALSAAMSGYAIWGSDIGGYQDVNPSSTPDDLFMRWTQLGALSPIMQMHRQISAGKQYPWSYGQAALDNYKAYAQLHAELFPYLYTAAQQATVDGMPIMRPLPLVASDDPNAATVGDEYELGDSVLVAPVVAQATTTRSVYLPAGGWYDYWTHAHHVGGQTIAWTGADATQAPMFVRDGAIVPRALDTLDFLVYPSASSQYTMYDGTAVACDATSSSTTITLTSAARAVAFDVFTTTQPTRITQDGVELPQGSWTYDGTFVHVAITATGAPTTLELDGTSGPKADGDNTSPPKAAGCCSTSPGSGAGWLVLALATMCMLLRRDTRSRCSSR